MQSIKTPFVDVFSFQNDIVYEFFPLRKEELKKFKGRREFPYEFQLFFLDQIDHEHGFEI